MIYTCITVASQSYIRGLMRLKSQDLLYTIKSVAQWCSVSDEKISFEITGCILLLLLIKAGSGVYPELNDEEVVDLLQNTDYIQSGWSASYSKLGVKYSKKLKQSMPEKKENRGSSVQNDSLVGQKHVTERIKFIRSLKRRCEDDHQDIQ